MRFGQAAQSLVLNILRPGGLLSAVQIQRQAHLTGWSTRTALSRLQARGLIVAIPHRGCWQISDRGREVAATARSVR
ncbi:type IV toxin-antitoxin system AbiEi family antitoxin domain-containing protein [Nocardia blacklockiae]|uniref:type IV toxin-antitoxin system AbiEi family antitoxin domain-containing protein n=1 Tax=Nocardia blacklockiae TaxID=480036 RepID=UPI00189601FC|nr:type IV toxin-antitoxin system AbiEi family antitoxin domain-containing protein [Nocardia blacklockiae]MBF6175080.1 type IV toxin-antitoxin system AbiEi family antitoxin domain-containing protein [Nocardia blacklockiae]